MRSLRPHRFAATVVTVLALGLTAAPADAHAADPAATGGVYRGAGAPAAIAQWDAWLGRSTTVVTDYFARGTWADLTNPWVTNAWAGSGRNVVYGLPLVPNSTGSLAQVAAGEHNARFATIALQLVAAGQRNAVLRPGLEFNGNWFRWSIGGAGGPADFVAAWRQVVQTMRAVPGANFKFDWNPALGGSWFDGKQIDPARAYPGDSFVDYIGMDVYDQDWMAGYRDPVQRWQNLKNQPYGLAWHRDFARAHGKPMTFPEWGLADRIDGHGGGDNPYFIEKMHDWIAANNVAYHMYFEYDEADSRHELMSGHFPRAAQRFKELFGATGAPTATTVATAPAKRGRKIRGRVLVRNASGTSGPVTVKVARRTGSGWKATRKLRTSAGQDGAYAKRLRMRSGRYRVQAVFHGNGTAKPSRSAYRRFRVG